MRKLTVGPSVYLWRVHHRHSPRGADGERRCAEVFSAYLVHFPGRPLRVLFPESAQHGPGFPSRSGVVVDYVQPTWHMNLNRPRAARLLIELAVLAGWAPSEARGEFVLSNGYELLRAHRGFLERYESEEDRQSM
jgi:hypothetical protein